MSKKKVKGNNLKLAGIFAAFVIGLILMSLALKLTLIILSSKFDGIHKFNVLVKGDNQQIIASFSPNPRLISIINLPKAKVDYSKIIEVPIDGGIIVEGDFKTKNLSTVFLKSLLPLGQKVEKLTFLDLFRLSLFARTIPSGSLYERDYSDELSTSQKTTVISLTFNDPTVYEENQTIEIINSTGINGLGTRLANFISNMGGNPILVTSTDKIQQQSKIVYFEKESYTVKRLSTYFNLVKEKTNTKGIADVTIVIGDDLVKTGKF